ncbi:DUF3850 domain-containing protein [Lactococcus lactis]|uniref:DUF3850 domain-containing protein n=1 Tax=Lactococcus lactis TaxID=1358 RepID=UPI003D292646
MKVIERTVDVSIFEDVESGRKPFEVCFNDCNYEVGDIIELKAYKADCYVRKDLNAYVGVASPLNGGWLYCKKSKAETIRVKILKVIHYGKKQGNEDYVILEFEIINSD